MSLSERGRHGQLRGLCLLSQEAAATSNNLLLQPVKACASYSRSSAEFLIPLPPAAVYVPHSLFGNATIPSPFSQGGVGAAGGVVPGRMLDSRRAGCPVGKKIVQR